MEEAIQVQSVRILGLGAVTGYGWGMPPLWAGLESRRAAARLHDELGGAFPVPCWFARVPDEPTLGIGSTRYQRAVSFAIDEAITDARSRGWEPSPLVGIVHATTRADLELMRARYLAPDTVPPRRAYVEQAWTTPSSLVMIKHRFAGPVLINSAACSSGLHALAVAQRLISCGDAGDVIVVASDIGFDGEEMTLFSSLGPLTYDAPPWEVCRPFHEGTRGFVLGEGAAALVLTRMTRGSEPYVELVTSAMGNDAYHPVAIEPSHRKIIATADRALTAAHIQPEDVRAFCAHGTGTRECQAADLAVLEHLGAQAAGCALKPLLGHCMGTAPLLDVVALARACGEGALPLHGQKTGACAPFAEAILPAAVGGRPPPRDSACEPDAETDLPLTSSFADPLIEGEESLALDAGPFIQVSLGFGGNICAAVYRVPAG